METSQPTQSTFGPGCRRNIFGNVLFLSDGEDSEDDNVSKQISQEKENRNNIIISSTSSNDDDSSHIELVHFLPLHNFCPLTYFNLYTTDR